MESSNSLDKERVLDWLFHIAAAGALFTLPFSIKVNGVFLIILAGIWLVDGKWVQKFDRFRSNPASLLVLLFLLHLIGLSYTENLKAGFFEIEKKFSFLLLTVVLTTHNYTRIRPIFWYIVLYSFVIGCLIAVLICLTGAFFSFLQHQDTRFFFYHDLSAPIGIHAVYFSWYLVVSVVILFDRLKAVSTKLSKALLASLICLFCLFVVLLSSKAMIVTLTIMVFYYIYHLLPGGFSRMKKFTSLLLLGLFLGGVLSIGAPKVRDRFVEILHDEFNQENVLSLDYYHQYHFTGANVRLAIWKVITLILQEDKAILFGVGTGDAQDRLTEEYVQRGFYAGDESLGQTGFLTYNAHNQFFQYLITFGLNGCIVFLIVLLSIVQMSILLKSSVLKAFCVSFVIFSMTESTLEVQKGIVFFVFMVCWLSRRHNYLEQHTHQSQRNLSQEIKMP